MTQCEGLSVASVTVYFDILRLGFSATTIKEIVRYSDDEYDTLRAVTTVM